MDMVREATVSEKAGNRNRERTRRALLDATAKLLRERGMGVSLDAIAEEAQVSKGGLLYHFPTRDELIRAVAEDTVTGFRARVLEHLDLSENHPGKLLRAYIRALFGSKEAQMQFDYPGLWDTLALVEGVTEILMADAAKWREDFATDGLHPERITVVFHAAEGFIANAQWDENITAGMVADLRDTLLALTQDSGPLIIPAVP